MLHMFFVLYFFAVCQWSPAFAAWWVWRRGEPSHTSCGPVFTHVRARFNLHKSSCTCMHTCQPATCASQAACMHTGLVPNRPHPVVGRGSEVGALCYMPSGVISCEMWVHIMLINKLYKLIVVSWIFLL